MFSASEVGTLIEDLEKKIDTVLEIVSPIPGKLEKIDDRLVAVETRLQTVEDAVRVTLPTIHKRLDKIETKLFA